MGMQGPLTAQALGRSPYDDVVEGEGDEDVRQPTQQYDYRGRPINPETRRMNRDIVRSHNEVMLVIGVAEAENPFSGPEAESQRRHEAYEDSVGLGVASSAKRCVEAVGIFGIDGLRQRILVFFVPEAACLVRRGTDMAKIYKRYSRIPFWELFQASRKDFSVSRDILAGAPTSVLTNYTERFVRRLWAGDGDRLVARRLLHEAWSYIRVHLELYVALQRLGLTPNGLSLPSLKFFIPFTEASPMPAPPAPDDFTLPSLLRWLGEAFISTTPFLVWVMAQRMLRDWKPQIWGQIFKRLPNTTFQGKKLPPPPPPLSSTSPEPSNESVENGNGGQEALGEDGQPGSGVLPLHDPDRNSASHTGSMGADRRPSIFSSRGDDYASDEDENEGVSATLISFDVEATESTDAPPGLWSAELRPSIAPDSKSNSSQQPVYLDTLLTQLPALVASHIFTDAVSRILMVPYEATALRLVARTLRLRQGLSCHDMHSATMLSGLSWTAAVNFFGTELLHLVACGEVWTVFACISQWLHMTEEEWKAEEGKA